MKKQKVAKRRPHKRMKKNLVCGRGYLVKNKGNKMRIEKENIVIRSANLEDAIKLNKWWNDGEIMEHAGFPKGLGLSLEETMDEIRRWEGKLSDLCIIEIDKKSIGELSYSIKGDGTVNSGWKICNPKYQNQGYGTTVIKMLLEFLFTDNEINDVFPTEEVTWDTMLENKRAQYVYEHKIKARKIKTKENSWQDQLGNWRSSVDYGISREEFFNEG